MVTSSGIEFYIVLCISQYPKNGQFQKKYLKNIDGTTSVRCMCMRCVWRVHGLCVRALCVRPDLSGLYLVHFCIDFKII